MRFNLIWWNCWKSKMIFSTNTTNIMYFLWILLGHFRLVRILLSTTRATHTNQTHSNPIFPFSSPILTAYQLASVTRSRWMALANSQFHTHLALNQIIASLSYVHTLVAKFLCAFGVLWWPTKILDDIRKYCSWMEHRESFIVAGGWQHTSSIQLPSNRCHINTYATHTQNVCPSHDCCCWC